MNFQILLITFFAISIVSGLLTFLAVPFFKAQKDSRLYVWMLCNFLYSLGSSLVALKLLENPLLSLFDMSDQVILIAQALRFYSVIGLILFLRSFSPKSFFQVSTVKIFLIILTLVSLSALIIGPHVPVEFKGAVVANFWAIFQIIWLLYELNLMKNSGEYQNNFSLRWLSIVACGLFVINLYLVLIAVTAYFNLMPLLEIVGADVQSAVFITRLLSSLLSLMGFILAFMFWVEGHSDLAIQSKSDSLRISKLLIEKDILINNLANANTLVETGALSAGLAHEINQFLGRIELNGDKALDLIKSQDTPSALIEPAIENILNANRSAAKVIKSLQILFKGSHRPSSLCNLDELVMDVVSIYRDRLEKSNIKIKMDLQVKEPWVVWDGLMSQVFSNLLANSIDALVTLTKSDKLIQIASRIDQHGSYQLILSDNGLGIDPEYQDKLFHLFQTSKSTGTGIGLWLSNYIVESHKGTLTFKNLPDRAGVSFILTLPPGKLNSPLSFAAPEKQM